MATCLHFRPRIPTHLLSKVGMFFVFSLIFLSSISAQVLIVKGVVTDATDNEPLPGVNIVIVGTKTGVTTDAEGNYQINIPATSAVLEFSFIGYMTEKVKVAGNNQINVALIQNAKDLEEVVAIGYGTALKGNISGAVSSLKADAIKDIPVASAAEALTGRIAGVQVSTLDGSPDAEVIIRVRGGGSITQNNAPLLIVDGFPTNNINDIAPTDIESYVVLKDASSTAIYGSRGANGVILITTKSAKAGKSVVSFNTYMQRKFFPMERKFEVLSPYEYVLSQYEYAMLKGTTEKDNFYKYYGDFDDIDIYKQLKGSDWQDEMFNSVRQYSKYYNIGVTGGTDKTKLNLSFTHNEDDGLIKTSGFIRDNLSFKMDHDISDKLRLQVNSRFSNTTTNGAGTSGSADLRISDVITARPTNGLADYIDLSNSTSTDDDEYEKLIEGLVLPTEKVKQDYRKKTSRNFNLNASIQWKIIDNLIFRSEFGVGYSYGISKRYWGPLTGKSRNDGGNLPLGQYTASNGSSYRLANTLTYDIKTVNHYLNLMVGQEINNSSRGAQDMTARYFPLGITPEKMFAQFAKGTILTQSISQSPDERLLSFFGRANYTLLQKHNLSLIIRSDGSSNFAPGNQWGFFPAASYSWRLSEEQFMKNLIFVSDLKLRASYGVAGNNQLNDLNLARVVFSVSNSRPAGFGESINAYYKPSSVMPNPDLRWETNITQNLGVDFGLFKNRLTGTVDAYRNQAKDLLIETPVPISTGYSSAMVNLGKTSNTGLEVTLAGIIVKQNDFELLANFNIGFNNFKVDYIDGANEKPVYSNWASSSDLKTADDYRIIVGQELGLMYGYVSDGFYTVDDFESYDPVTKKYKLKEGLPTNDLANNIGLRPGVMKLKDLDGDKLITSADREVIGHAAAKNSGGFGLNAIYKGFDCSAFFNWKYGFDVYNTSKIQYNTRYRNDNANLFNTMNYSNRFKYINETTGELVTDLEQLRELNKDAKTWSPYSTSSAVLVFQSEAVEDGSFLRLSNLTIGYSLPKSVISKVYIQKLRFYATVYNAWLWTKYSGYDPDVSTNRSNSNYSNLSPNVDFSSYPKSRSITMGINVTF